MYLLTTFAIALGINLAMFFPAYYLKTDKLTDISYAVSFIVVGLASFALSQMGFLQAVLLAMIFVWALRLGGYLLFRIIKMGKDSRFDQRRENFWSFLNFWILQGITVWVVLLPSTIFFKISSGGFSTLAYSGILIWLAGFLIETFADFQKYHFINNPNNKGKWADVGLWKYSRHPNYFGEILLWVGVYVFTLSALGGWQALVGLVGPLYVALLIIFASGIPLLERAADKRWGNDPAYQEYKRKTSILIPFFNKK